LVADAPTPFGVGIMYGGALTDFIARNADLIDVVSLTPEILWHEAVSGSRFRWIRRAVEAFEGCFASKGIVLHGIGLSIVGEVQLDLEHLDQVCSVAEKYGAQWYSEHLSAFRGIDQVGRSHAGVGLPVPFDEATFEQVASHVTTVVERVGLPVLLENSAIYVEVPEADMTEAGFLNRLSDRTGSGVLLDLHNLFVNEVNLGWEAEAYLDELDLGNVVEMHVAGGEMLGEWYTDAHSGACPERVWELLGLAAPRAPALRLVTFELHDSRVPVLGEAGIAEQLSRVRAIRDSTTARVA
jgi:uncharacterized protein (UPF0276 family)